MNTQPLPFKPPETPGRFGEELTNAIYTEDGCWIRCVVFEDLSLFRTMGQRSR